MSNVLDSILAVFTAMGEWLIDSVNMMVGLFYSAETGLTFIGTVSICSLAMGVAFLLIGLVQKFLRFR